MTTTYEQIMERISYALIEKIVNTTATSISGSNPGVTVFSPVSMSGIYTGALLILDTGSNQEVVSVSSTTTSTFTATTTLAHSIGIAVVGATFPSGQTDAPLFTQSEIIGYINDAQTDFLLDVRPLYEVQTVPVTTAQRFYGQPADCIRPERIAINPGVSGSTGFTQLAAYSVSGPNANPLPPALWSVGLGGFAALQLLGGTIQASVVGVDCFETYSGTTFPSNQFALIIVGSVVTNGDEISAGVLTSGPLGYFVDLSGPLGVAATITLVINTSVTETTLGTFTGTVNTGDQILLAAVNGVISVYLNGTSIISVADATFSFGLLGCGCAPATTTGNATIGGFSAGAAGFYTTSYQTVTMDLYETSQSSLDLSDPYWQGTQGLPQQWFRDQINTGQYGLTPLPSANYAAELWYSQNLLIANSTLTTMLLVPDLFAYAMKYSALAKCWSKDGETRDPMRAEFCQKKCQFITMLAVKFMNGAGVNMPTGTRGDPDFSPMPIPQGAMNA